MTKLPQYDSKGTTNYCFGCEKIRSECKCEGGYKICFWRGVAYSSEELKNRDPIEKKSMSELYKDVLKYGKEVNEGFSKLFGKPKK